ncbi:MgtC family protein [Sulfitobacter noctilucae]|uniref:MgtC/SapB family protein n=1 Tax=Sulfitobacter noctilucae TaxID=1342302 RepID=UPI000469257C|nr:MgtC/SapB family protein [Sulfitobacter noctilucae]KIN65849.1 MgtC family protein [Sulfitobacter noctilucae]
MGSDFLANIGFSFEQTDWFLRLIVALLAGAILGLDREVRQRRIGIRTYMMVSLGSAIFTIVSVEMSQDLQASDMAADPTRVIQGLMGGLGFLGAGAIIQGNKRVGGMVTAASLWVAGALGLSAGMGYGMFSLVCAGLAAALLAISRFMEHRGSADRPDLND